MGKRYFISGHRDILEDEFQKHYEDKIFKAINDGASFVVGDCAGADLMAQKYLKAFNVKDVNVYHLFDEPKHNVGFPLVGGFQSHSERNRAMTEDTTADIAWVRDGKEKSGTAQNINRRKGLR